MQSFQVFPNGPAENESVSNVTLTPSVPLGTCLRNFKGEDYVYVYNSGTGPINQGALAVLSANSGYSVMASSITQYDFAFGVAKHATFPTAAYGWLLTRGFTPVQNGMVGTALTTGDILIPAANGGACIAAVSMGTGITETGVPFGQVVSGCASGGTGASQCLAYVSCFGS